MREPLPAEAVSPNPLKPGLSAIKVIYVVERLNDVFGLNGWHMDNEVVETGRMVVVRATLAIPKYGIAIEQFGGNDNPDRGDAYKGACTDALSKCASYLGIGMEVYKGLTDNRPRDGGGGRHNVRATSRFTGAGRKDKQDGGQECRSHRTDEPEHGRAFQQHAVRSGRASIRGNSRAAWIPGGNQYSEPRKGAGSL